MNRRRQLAVVASRIQANALGDANNFWYESAGAPSLAGLDVNAESAMRLSAVYRCVCIVAGTLGSLPLSIYKRLPDGGKEEASDHPLYELLHDAPNDFQTPMEFFEMMEAHRALRGNAIAEIIPGTTRAIDQLIPLHPDRVQILRLANGRIGYNVSPWTGGQTYRLTQAEVFHLRGLSFDGIRGISPIWYQRDTIGTALGGQQFAARFFANDATPGGVIEHPLALKEPGRDNLKRTWREAHGGVGNAHSIAVLEEGMKYHQVGISNRDAQFIETQKHSLGDIARIFGVPLHMISELDRATFSNIEQQSLEFVRDTIRPNCERVEGVVQRTLINPFNSITGPDKYFAEFNLDALLRADFKTRQEGNAIQLQNGALDPDEWRSLENRNKRSDGRGGQYYRAANIVPDTDSPASKAAPGLPPSRPAQPPPEPGTENEAGLVTIRVRRELAVALNGNAQWEEAA